MSTIVSSVGVAITDDVWPEGCEVGYDVDFTDEDGNAYAPDSNITGVVIDKDGTVLETLSAISPASSIEVTTAAATNDITSKKEERIIALEWTAITTRYPSPGITQKLEIHYQVADLIGS